MITEQREGAWWVRTMFARLQKFLVNNQVGWIREEKQEIVQRNALCADFSCQGKEFLNQAKSLCNVS
jgi:hypothetical protein